MRNPISRRCLVRIISYTLALVLVLGIACVVYKARAASAELKLEAGYLRAVENLNDSMSGISNTLIKGKYANTAPMLESLANKLKADTQTAKESLSVLPLGNLHLENTYKFLSQLGEYTLSLSRKLSRGETISKEDAEKMDALQKYAVSLQEEVRFLEDAVQSGTTDFGSIVHELEESEVGTEASPGITDGFLEYEEGFSEFPSLIYDGPFSDHLMESTPSMTEEKEEVSLADARKVAMEMTNLPEEELVHQSNEAGKMPSYLFSTEEITAAVTKQGGLPVYYLNSRTVEEITLSKEEGVKRARAYLERLSIGALAESYYEVYGNIMTVNFAAVQEDVILYPDLIKVSVAMDNGDILGFDARGYLMNHHTRKFPAVAISTKAAREKVSPNLTVKKERLAIIPSNSLEEKLCYEFLCTGKDGENILVYINAQTGLEEEIFILLIDENGTLTF